MKRPHDPPDPPPLPHRVLRRAGLRADAPDVTVATVPASSGARATRSSCRLSGQWPDGCVPEASRTNLSAGGLDPPRHLQLLGLHRPLHRGRHPLEPRRRRRHSSPPGATPSRWRVSRTLMPAETIGTRRVHGRPASRVDGLAPGLLRPRRHLLAREHPDRIQQHGQRGDRHATSERGTRSASPRRRPRSSSRPHAAGILDSRSLREGQPVQMLSLRAPRRVALRATLERLETVPEGLPKVPESLGRVELPVFTELFPAGIDGRRRRRLPLGSRVRERPRGAPPRQPHPLQRRDRVRDVPRLGDLRGRPVPAEAARSTRTRSPRSPSSSSTRSRSTALPVCDGRRRLVPDHRRPAVPRLRLHGPAREPARRPALRDLPRARRPLTRLPRRASPRLPSPERGPASPAPALRFGGRRPLGPTRCSADRPRASPSGRLPRSRRRRGTRGGPRGARGRGSGRGCASRC